MVTVILLGEKNQIVCDYCDSVLAYQRGDVQEHELPTSPFIVSYIKCPVCNSDAVIKDR